MYVKKLRIEVISPFYYYSHGGQVAIPGDFLGDIALFYALMYSMKGLNFPLNDLRKEHIASSDFLVTVGKPLNIKRKPVMIVASVFKDALHKFKDIYAREGGSYAYKNIRKIKAFDIGTAFEAYFISKVDYALPNKFGLRIGVNRDGLLLVTTEVPNFDDEVWINLFTIKSKNIPPDALIQSIREITFVNRYYKIIKGIRLKDFLDIVKGHLQV